MSIDLDQFWKTLHAKLDDGIDQLKSAKAYLESLQKETEAAIQKRIKTAKTALEEKKKDVEDEELPTAEELMEDEAAAQTNIQIIRREQPELPEENEIAISDRKKVDLEKTGELPAEKFISDEEKELPDPWEEDLDYELPGLDLLQPAAAEDLGAADRAAPEAARTPSARVRRGWAPGTADRA